eukprot:TRINITY_DN3915_c0_g1_i2.p1 TRINITY_DN3915_c0_g1~~TRINITY_DN3915_c0_g1_i2.p1  ORF type:complete len:413 (-),score=37.39 TRINITY_DN3915_c0_g1_i2:533-1771(-)
MLMKASDRQEQTRTCCLRFRNFDYEHDQQTFLRHKTNSLKLLYTYAFIVNVESSILLPTLYTYFSKELGQTQTDIAAKAVGWALASFSASQLVSALIVYYLVVQRDVPIRLVMLVSTMLLAVGNVIYVGVASIDAASALAPILLARSICGCGAGASVIGFRYVTQVCRGSERTHALHTMSGIVLCGLVLGPVFSVAFAAIPETAADPTQFRITGTGYLSAIAALVYCAVMLNKFKDVSTYATTLSDVKQVVVFNVAAKPKSWPGKVACFVMQFCFSFQIGTLETVAIPLVDNRFAFTTVYNCLTFLCIGVITITVILIQRVMRFKERTALLVGIFLMIAALITAFQYPVHGFAPTFGLFCVTIALMATGFALTVATVPVIYASLIERSAHRVSSGVMPVGRSDMNAYIIRSC